MSEQPVRVLRVVGKMNSGGLETVIMNCYRITDRRKLQYDFIVHTDEEGIFDAEIKKLGGKIYHMPRYNYLNHMLYCKLWKRFFQEHPEYKIVHGHMRSTAAIYLKIAQKYGRTTIAHSHGVSSGYGIAALAKDFLQRNILQYSDYMLACSKMAGEWLFGKDILQNPNFMILKNGIDSSKFQYNEEIRHEVRREFGLNGKIVIGHVGRFDDAKNQIFLVNLMDSKREQIGDKYIVLLIGAGPDFEYVKREIDEKGLENNFLMLGVRSDVDRLMQAMDVFVFPSKYEGFGNVVVEAQASGLPCVISENIPEDVIITDLVSQASLSGDMADWWEKIDRQVSNAERKNYVPQIMAAGYDVHNMVEWYEEFYLHCTEKDYQIKDEK